MGDTRVAELVRRARNGDEAAVERLYCLHSQRIYTLCLYMTSNQAEAEDLTQEAFLQAFRKLNAFRGEAAFSTWIYRIAINVVLMRFRRKKLPEVSLEDVTGHHGVPARIVRSDKLADPAGNLVDRLTLRRALDQLPKGFKRVLIMHDIQGYEHNEIAKLTGRTVGNSKSQLHRARRRLRELLGAASHA